MSMFRRVFVMLVSTLVILGAGIAFLGASPPNAGQANQSKPTAPKVKPEKAVKIHPRALVVAKETMKDEAKIIADVLASVDAAARQKHTPLSPDFRVKFTAKFKEKGIPMLRLILAEELSKLTTRQSLDAILDAKEPNAEQTLVLKRWQDNCFRRGEEMGRALADEVLEDEAAALRRAAGVPDPK